MDRTSTVPGIRTCQMRRACPTGHARDCTDQQTGFRPVGQLTRTASLPVLAVHLLQNDRMPTGIALIRGDVVLACPAAESEFLDKVQVHQYADADHGSTLRSHPARNLWRTGRGSADHPAALEVYRPRNDRQASTRNSLRNLCAESYDRECISFPIYASCAGSRGHEPPTVIFISRSESIRTNLTVAFSPGFSFLRIRS